MTPAPIIAISGHPGGGKTSLTKALRDRLGVPALHYDDHEKITSLPPEDVMEWIARGSNYDEIRLDSLGSRDGAIYRSRSRGRFAFSWIRCLGGRIARLAS